MKPPGSVLDLATIVSRYAVWFAFIVAVLGSLSGLSLGGNWLILMPVVVTAAPLLAQRSSAAIPVSILSAVFLAALVVVMSLSVGRFFLASLGALIVGTLLQVTLRIAGPAEHG